MKIFLPFKKDANNYFDEIIKFSRTEFVFDDYKNYDSSFKIVNIHWPESIFNWRECTTEELNDFEKAILTWKKHSKIIYTVHNLRPHSGFTSNSKRLYKLVEDNADYFLHLGEFSKKKFEEKFRSAEHCIVNHPLYNNSFKIYSREEARKALAIKSDALVIISPGKIRTATEKKMVLNSFNSLKNENKVLIVHNMYRRDYWNQFPGYYKLKKMTNWKKIFDRFLKNRYRPPIYHFNYGYVGNEKLSLMMSASDVVFIPRKNILNSGNVFLGLTYKKIIVGPNQGNIKEFLEMFNFPIFNPMSSKSVKIAINEAVSRFEKNEFEIDPKKLESFSSINVAGKFDDLIKKISLK